MFDWKTLFIRSLRTGISCILIGLICSCAEYRVVHVPIPIPTFGLGGRPTDHRASTRNKKTEPGIAQKTEEGVASWYGKRFQGRPTASGERYDMNAMTAAHPTLPFDTKIKVTALDTGKSAYLRVNDRGPFDKKGRIIDVSRAAARKLGFEREGVARVRVEIIQQTK